ncbi:MAG: hypothetical protein AAGF12_13740 [Myxococcota bacterium]
MSSVLFVGNSYTFYNDMPQQVAALGPPLVVHTSVEGGANVELHFKELGTPEKIRTLRPKNLVLQDNSTGPLHSRARFDEFLSRLAAVGAEVGAELFVYQTWARAETHEVYRSGWSGGSPKAMTERLRNAYHEVAAQIQATVVPVGDAWETCLDEETLVLHDEDLHHASPLGSHLAALTFHGALSGADPRAATYVPPGVADAEATVLRRHAARALGWSHER